MPAWRFFDYVTEGGANAVQEWYAAQEAEAQAGLDQTILLLRGVPDWLNPERKEFAELFKKHAGLFEIRFWPFGRFRKFRVAGIYRPNESEFILLTGCEKRMGIYFPR